MRRLMVAGNWKMNGSSEMIDALVPTVVAQVAERSPSVDVVLCPPAVYLHKVNGLLPVDGRDAVALGAQNVSEHASGAFTGEAATSMLLESGCQFVIVGHSERRQIFGESDEQVGAKAEAVLAAGMTPIVCLGETLDERESGQTERVVGRQLDAVIATIKADGIAQSILAYEPVWAIGTGKTASGEQAQAVHAYLRAQLSGLDAGVAASTRILYGGSVKGDNAAALFAEPDIDGGLIGGASLAAADFLAIVFAGNN